VNGEAMPELPPERDGMPSAFSPTEGLRPGHFLLGYPLDPHAMAMLTWSKPFARLEQR
jgi:hypothetical protein